MPLQASTLPYTDRTWDIMGKNDGLGDYEGILTAVLNSTAYAAGFRKVRAWSAGLPPPWFKPAAPKGFAAHACSGLACCN
jgi:hypothetical protein